MHQSRQTVQWVNRNMTDLFWQGVFTHTHTHTHTHTNKQTNKAFFIAGLLPLNKRLTLSSEMTVMLARISLLQLSCFILLYPPLILVVEVWYKTWRSQFAGLNCLLFYSVGESFLAAIPSRARTLSRSHSLVRVREARRPTREPWKWNGCGLGSICIGDGVYNGTLYIRMRSVNTATALLLTSLGWLNVYSGLVALQGGGSRAPV